MTEVLLRGLAFVMILVWVWGVQKAWPGLYHDARHLWKLLRLLWRTW
jgi:hypothetical protein